MILHMKSNGTQQHTCTDNGIIDDAHSAYIEIVSPKMCIDHT